MSETAYKEAVRVLKATGTVPAADDGEATRLRIQASLRAERPRQLRRRRRQLVLLSAACLAASSALAFYVAQGNHEPPASVTRGRVKESAPQREPEVLAHQPLERAPVEPLQASSSARAPEGTLRPSAASPTAHGKSRRARSSSRPAAPDVSIAGFPPAESAAVSSAPAPRAQATEQERQALYMNAHRLHFGPVPQSALAAWNTYLATEPTGPLAIEARYNRAVVLARLGQREEARKALLPFANGTYGSFRQADAALLLSQLE